MRRLTRLTNAFSRKFENRAQMVAVYSVFYNLRNPEYDARDASRRPQGDRVWDMTGRRGALNRNASLRSGRRVVDVRRRLL